MSAALLWFEAGMITGSVIASAVWLLLSRRHRRRCALVSFAYSNVAQQARQAALLPPPPPDPYRPLPQHRRGFVEYGTIRRRW